MSYFCSPLRYPGGKSCIFPFVSNLFYENDLIGISYAEPYAGGAGLALRLLFEEYVNHIYINDYDKAIYAFWSAVINRADEFCQWIAEVDISLENWRSYKDIHRSEAQNDLFELAKATLFLNRTNISGIIKGGVIGGSEQKGKYKINARFRKDDLIQKIQKIKKFKNRISLSNLDGLAFIKKLDRRKEEIFIYLDPPYYNKAKDLYMNFYSESDHQKLSSYVNKMKKRWMVSYDNHDFILNLYAQNNKVSYLLSQNTSNRLGSEILVFAKSIQFDNSIQHLKSSILF